MEGDEYTPSRTIALKLVDALGITDKADRLAFLLSANVGSLADLKGFRLVPETSETTHTGTDKPQSPPSEPSPSEEAPRYKPLRPSPRWRGPTE